MVRCREQLDGGSVFGLGCRRNGTIETAEQGGATFNRHLNSGMPPVCKGHMNLRVPMPKLAMQEVTDVAWLDRPNAPRAGKGSKYLKITGSLPVTPKRGPFSPGVQGPFSPGARLKRTPGEHSHPTVGTHFASGVNKKVRSPVFRRTPTGRRRVRKTHDSDSDGAATALSASSGRTLTTAASMAGSDSFKASARDSSASNDASSHPLGALLSARTKSRLPRTPGGDISSRRAPSGRRLSMNVAKTPAPPSTPFTPAPARPVGELAIARWLEELGLDRTDGLLEALLSVADCLHKLGEISEVQLNAATAELYLRGVKARKLHAAVAALKSEHESAFLPKRNTELAWKDGALERPLEAPLDMASSVTHLSMADMPPPPRPRIGDLRMPANANPPRFMPRTMAEISAVPSEPEQAAFTLGLIGPSEAREISELAELFGAGAPNSPRSGRSRPTHGLAARAAASAASVAAAAAMDAAAKASEKVVAAAAAHAKRREVGLNDDITPRSRESVEMLALDLRSALDEASAQAKAAAQEEMTKAIAKVRVCVWGGWMSVWDDVVRRCSLFLRNCLCRRREHGCFDLPCSLALLLRTVHPPIISPIVPLRSWAVHSPRR